MIPRRTWLKLAVAATTAPACHEVLAESPSTSPGEESPQKGAGGTDKQHPRVTPFLMFTGQAEEAMRFYVALIEGSKIEQVTRYGANETGPEGSVRMATFSLAGQAVMCIDSPPVHDFTFTPAVSLFVSCPEEEQVDRYFQALAKGGKVLMPLDAYDFSKKFAWVQDRFGVSWQLTLA